MAARLMCFVLYVVSILAIFALTTLGTGVLYQLYYQHINLPRSKASDPQPSADQLRHSAQGDVHQALANVLSGLGSMERHRTLLHDSIQRSIKSGIWEGWAVIELSKLALIHQDAISLIENAHDQIDEWSKQWRSLDVSVTGKTEHLRREIDEATSVANRYVVVHLRTSERFHDPYDSAFYHKLCQLADETVEYIIVLLGHTVRVVNTFAKLYDIFGRMSFAAMLISNTTGTSDWRRTSVIGSDTCLARNQSIEEYGTKKQKYIMGLVRSKLGQHQDEIQQYDSIVHRMTLQLGQEYKHYQVFQLARQCTIPLEYANLSQLNPRRLTLTPQDLIRYLSGYLDILLWRR